MRAAQALVKSMLGRRVLKDFGEGAHFGGAVVHVSREAASSKALFTIAYDDGDEEDVYLSELRCILVPSASSPRANVRCDLNANFRHLIEKKNNFSSYYRS
jgi:hypothetical protein